jgi:hypothetical protein
MIDDDAILNRIAKAFDENFEKFGWAATLGDKFEVWFQIEICLAFFGEWPEAPQFFFHTPERKLDERDRPRQPHELQGHEAERGSPHRR